MCRVVGSVGENLQWRGQCFVGGVAQIQKHLCVFANGRRLHETHRIYNNFPSGACQRVGQSFGHAVGTQHKGLLIAEKACVHSAFRHVIAVFPEIKCFKQEVAVKIPSVTPVDVIETLRIHSVDNKGVSGDVHGVSCVEHGPSGVKLTAEQIVPILWPKFVTI